MTYNYFNGVGSGIPNLPTYDTHREAFGFEKTFLQGDASIGMRFNTLQNTGDGSLGNSVFGDIHVISKFALINDYDTGNVLSGGLVVSIPTGPDAILPDGSRIDPVLLQPWTGGIWNRDKFFLQGFSSIVIPTDSRDSMLALSDLGAGYKLFQATDCSDSIISYVVPTSEVHVTIPYTKHGVNLQPVGVPDIVVLTNGFHIGIGKATDFTLAVAVPVTGPKTFDVEAVAQLNWRFGAMLGERRRRRTSRAIDPDRVVAENTDEHGLQDPCSSAFFGRQFLELADALLRQAVDWETIRSILGTRRSPRLDGPASPDA